MKTFLTYLAVVLLAAWLALFASMWKVSLDPGPAPDPLPSPIPIYNPSTWADGDCQVTIDRWYMTEYPPGCFPDINKWRKDLEKLKEKQ